MVCRPLTVPIAVVGVALVSVASDVCAQSGEIQIIAPTCEQPLVDPAALPDLLGAELSATRLGDVVPGGTRLLSERESQTEPEGEVLAKLTLLDGCDSEPELTVQLEDRVTDKTLTRSLALGDTEPPHRPRIVAIAMAELIRASWLELLFIDDKEHPSDLTKKIASALGAQTAAPTEPASPNPPAGDSTPSVEKGTAQQVKAAASRLTQREVAENGAGERTSLIEGGPAVQLFTEDGTVLYGLHVAAYVSPRVYGTATLGLGAVDHALGDMTLGMVSLGVGATLLTIRGTNAEVALGARGSIGTAWGSGESQLPNVVGETATSTLLQATLDGMGRYWVSAAVALTVHIQASIADGLVALADDRRVASIDGFGLGAMAGIAIQP